MKFLSLIPLQRAIRAEVRFTFYTNTNELMCGFIFLFPPQSCGDDISLDAGFQGVKGDAAQHLQRKKRDESQRLPLPSPAVRQVNRNRPLVCPASCVLSSHLRLSSLEHRGAVQRFEEVDDARNAPQIRQLSPVTPTRQEKKERKVKSHWHIRSKRTPEEIMTQRHQHPFTFYTHSAPSFEKCLCSQC